MFTVGPVAENAFLFHQDGSTEALIVDPGDEAPKLLGAIKELGLDLQAILLTHTHFDHVGAVAPVAKATGAPVYCPKLEVPVLQDIMSFVPWPGFGPFESWDPAGRTFDAVIAAQAWHWVDPVAGAAKAALALRPGGRLTVFWNAFRAPPSVNAAFTAVYQRVLPESPIHQHGMPGPDGYQVLCDRAAEAASQVGAFGAPEYWRFDWERRYSRDEWLDQQSTFGGHNLLPAAKLDELVAGIGAAIDEMGGAFTMPYTTVAVSAVRT